MIIVKYSKYKNKKGKRTMQKNVQHVDALRVNINGEYYILIIKNERHGEKHHEFFAINDDTGDVQFMFGLSVENEEDAIEIAISNAADYIIPFKA